MKKLLSILSIAAIALVVACGPSKEEVEKKRVEDSIKVADSLKKIEDAKKATEEAEKKKQDSIKAEEAKKAHEDSVKKGLIKPAKKK